MLLEVMLYCLVRQKTIFPNKTQSYKILKLIFIENVVVSQNARYLSLNKTAIHSDVSGEYLWDLMLKSKSQGMIKINVPKNYKHAARLAVCDIKFDKIKVWPPKNYMGSEADKKTPLSLYAIS